MLFGTESLQGGLNVLKIHGGSLLSALVAVYPHLAPTKEFKPVIQKTGEKKLRKVIHNLFNASRFTIMYL